MILAVLALAACEGPSRTSTARTQQSGAPATGVTVSGYAQYGLAGKF